MRRVAAVLLLCLLNALLPSAAVLALAAPQQVMPIACRIHGAPDCGMIAAMDGMAMPGMTMDGRASGAVFRAPGCPSNHCFQAILSDSVTVPSRRGASVVLAPTFFPLLKPTSDSLPALTFSSSTPRAPPSSSFSPLSHV